MLYSSVYNLFALIGREAPFTHSLFLSFHPFKGCCPDIILKCIGFHSFIKKNNNNTE